MDKIVKVSVIIPVYNTGNKLRRCLDSVLEQDYQNYECIIINDGSTDDSGKIIDEYVQRDHRFIVIHKTNGGVSSARNAGLQIARGEWLVFVDSDDILMTCHLSQMLSVSTNDVDIVLTGFRFLHPSNITEHSYRKDLYRTKIEISDFILSSEFLGYQIPWDRMYRNKCQHGHCSLRFDEKLSLSEDRLFCYEYLLHCRGIATTDTITYTHDGTDQHTLSYRIFPSSMNEYKYKIFKSVINKLIKMYSSSQNDENRLKEYMDNAYTTLLDSYRYEKKYFSFYKTKVLFKLGLL